MLVNVIAFQAGWFSCVLGAANGYPMLGPVAVLLAVSLHLAMAYKPRRELVDGLKPEDEVVRHA